MQEKNGEILNIKSKFILKKIFSHLEKVILLDVISHNKYLQNTFSVNIKDYKNFSIRYIKGNKNRMGKEYSIDSDIY